LGDEVEVELKGVSLGEEVAAAGERFQIEELVFDQAMDGFDLSLEGVSGGGCGGAGCHLKRRESR